MVLSGVSGAFRWSKLQLKGHGMQSINSMTNFVAGYNRTALTLGDCCDVVQQRAAIRTYGCKSLSCE